MASLFRVYVYVYDRLLDIDWLNFGTTPSTRVDEAAKDGHQQTDHLGSLASRALSSNSRAATSRRYIRVHVLCSLVVYGHKLATTRLRERTANYKRRTATQLGWHDLRSSGCFARSPVVMGPVLFPLDVHRRHICYAVDLLAHLRAPSARHWYAVYIDHSTRHQHRLQI